MSEEVLDLSLVCKTDHKQVIINKTLNRIKNELNFHTSTPNSKLNIMDLSFPKCFKQVSQSFVSSDSGYVSRNQDSNESSGVFMENYKFKPEKCVYMSEDALLEKPKSDKENVSADTSTVYQEFSHLYYINNIIDESVSPVKSVFSGLQDSDTSLKSSQSSVLPPQEAIVVDIEKLQFLISLDSKLKSPKLNELSCNSFETSYNSENSNIENNINVSNISETKRINGNLKRKRSLSKTPQKQYKNNVKVDFSPDLFSDEEKCDVVPRIETAIVPERFITTSDKLLMKRVNRTLSGVLPPPSLTTTRLTVDDILGKIEANKDYFWVGKCHVEKADKKRSLLINTECDDCVDKIWPDILEDRYHGLHYNRSKLSEELENLYSKYAQRYIGAETQSTCTTFAIQGSPTKRKTNKLRWLVKSPGRRLSHLARRRITFSSANLQSNSSTTSKQVLVDARRYDLLNRRTSPRKSKSPRKTPRKTPRRSPRKLVKTPRSSVKKRLEFRLGLLEDWKKPEPSNNSKASATKRALFQSPDKIPLTKIGPSTSSNSSLSPLLKKGGHKRALFTSPSKSSENMQRNNNKRKRLDSGDSIPCKLPRNFDNKSTVVSGALTKMNSENNLLSRSVTELSAHHKKKLQWAVYEALRSQNIGVSHPQFKQFASVLARVTRRLLPNVASLPRSECGTSERMLRISKQHVFNVIKGKTVEEIIASVEKGRVKVQKPQGYVGLDAPVSAIDVSMARNAFQDRANFINSAEKSKVGQNDNSINKSANKADRVRKIINFDDDSSLGSLRSRF